jgi:hypothetical protein
MTPKEEAQSLWLEYYELLPDGIYSTQAAKIEAKKYALIAVDKCINLHFNLESDRNGIGESFKYWQKVKTEIENLKF